MISSSISRHSIGSNAPRTSSSVHTVSLLRILSLGSLFLSVRSQLFPAVIELSSLDGTTGFVLNGIATDDYSGWSVSSAGDVNADGVDDLIIGASRASPSGRSGAGQSYVVFGKSGLGSGGTLELSSLDGTTGFVLNGIASNDNSGTSVSSAGDVNADSVADLIVGAYIADPSGRLAAGQSCVVFGKLGLGTGGTLELSSLDGTTGFVLNGIASSDQSGYSVSSAGDVNADGVSDLIIGARYASPSGRSNAGQGYVVFGRSGLGFGGTLELSSLDGTTGFALNGIANVDRSGSSVSSAGDVNADGVSDLIIGASYADPTGRVDAGQSYVVFGRSGLGSGGTLELSSLDGTTGFTLNGIAYGYQSGYSVSGAGDVNADGISDLIIGAYLASPLGRSNAGQSYVVFGRSGLGSGGTLELSALNGTTGFVLNGIAGGDQSGNSVSSAGDVNADGVADLIIGARYADPSGRSAAGQSYVVFGRKPGTTLTINLTSVAALASTSITTISSFIASTKTTLPAQSSAATNVTPLTASKRNTYTSSTLRSASMGVVESKISNSATLTVSPLSTMTKNTQPPSELRSATDASVESKISRSATSLEESSRATSVLPAEPSESLSLGLPLGIAAGVCALISSIAASVLMLRKGKKADQEQPPPQSPPSEYTAISSLGLSSSHYDQPKLQPAGSHYVGDKELQELNRQQIESNAHQSTINGHESSLHYVDIKKI